MECLLVTHDGIVAVSPSFLYLELPWVSVGQLLCLIPVEADDVDVVEVVGRGVCFAV